MFLLLLVCVVLCFALQDYPEGGLLSLFVFFNIGLTVFQERKTERALDALRDLSAPRAVVVRDGRQVTVAGREVVRGDTILIKEGDRVAADIAVTWCSDLSANESQLTGESMPVRKRAGEETAEIGRPGGDDLPSCFCGSMIVSGQGCGIVKATGHLTSLGQIGKSLESVKPEKTPLERETRKLVLVMLVFGLAIAAVVFLYFGLAVKQWLKGALAAITLAMGCIPQEFPVILAVFMSLGAWRISKSSVLTRSNGAIETLGSCTVLCTDKTGTLTMNQMMVQALWDKDTEHLFSFHNPADKEERVDDKVHHIVEYAILSSKRDPFDPMESALWALTERNQVDAEHVHLEWDMLKEYPLCADLLATSRVYSTPQNECHLIAAVKGAPEAVADLCHAPAAEVERMRKVVNTLASQGLRVLGVARCEIPFQSSGQPLPSIQHDIPYEFIGLVAFIDPVRPTVPAAVKSAYEAGMRIAMITGDYPGTARAIAEKVGLTSCDAIVTGPEMDKMSDEELRARVVSTTIFARVVPAQKLRIVQAYKACGDIVAMTGDGVNDAPALKAAHIGIAMGKRGCDVAREAAHLVLLDDDFGSIVTAVRLGRRIYDNLRKAMAFVISIHIPLAGLILIPTLLNWGPVFHAVHVACMEMVIDPSCSVVLEAEGEEPGIMKRPPRDSKKSLVTIPTAIMAAVQGCAILAAAMASYKCSQLWAGYTEKQARSLSFATVIVANLGLIVEDRAWERWFGTTILRPNKAMWVITGIAIPVLALVLFCPGVIILFAFERMTLVGIPVFIVLGLVSSLWFELVKPFRTLFMRRRHHLRALRLAAHEQRNKPVSIGGNEHATVVECTGN